jgi:hypothetical protein
MLLAMTEKKFKEATWWPQYLEAKPLELFVNLEESSAAFRKAHPEFENESLGPQKHRGSIGLKNPQPVTPAEFRVKYPNFAPDGWWDYRSDIDVVINRFNADITREPTENLQWRNTQAVLRGAWDGGFPLDPRTLMILLAMVIDPQELNEGDNPLLGNTLQINPESTYYKSLVWLNSQPWRARVCKPCGRRFIASWPRNRFCSQHCIPTAQPSYKRDFRKVRSDKYNANRRKARAKANLKRTQRRDR